MTTSHHIRAIDLQPGDLILFLGGSHRVLRLGEYSHPVATNGDTWIRVLCDDSWSINLDPMGQVEIAERPA